MALRIVCVARHANGKALVSCAFQCVMKKCAKYRLDVWTSKRQSSGCRGDGAVRAGAIRPLAKRIDLPTKIH
jgi:hypothetical protein